MPSELIVPVVSVASVTPHPNADRLDLATVLGWQVAVARGSVKAGDKRVYFPPDVCLPSREFADSLGVSPYLKSGDALRVSCQNLRGIPSFGFLARLEECGLCEDTPVGENVAEVLGVTKWSPPRRQALPGLPPIPGFPRYTEVHNLRHFPDELVEGEPVYISEKIHGTNCRIGMIDGVLHAGSHRRHLKPVAAGVAEDTIYWYPSTLPPVVSLLTRLHEEYRCAVVLFGEVFGGSVMGDQFAYGVKKNQGLGFAAFDLWLSDGGYMDALAFLDICAAHSVPVVPRLFIGSWSTACLRLADGDTLLAGGVNMREGMVVRPLTERWSEHMKSRCILKYVASSYLLRHAKGKIPDFVEE